MLLQTPSKILKSDFRQWESFGSHAVADIFPADGHSEILKSCREILLEISGECKLNFEEETTLLILPLYGEIIINNFYESISAGESLLVEVNAGEKLSVKNHVLNDKADILVFEFRDFDASGKYLKNMLDFSLNSLQQLQICHGLNAMLGLYQGRKEGFYSLKKSGGKIFGLVLNGAFEFQNRLMENRDAIVLSEIDELEFEALSENALVIFLEI